MWEPKFALLISVIRGKSRNPNFPEVSDSLRDPTTSDQINAENMKKQQNKFLEKLDLYFEFT